ncbi:N-acetylneuraminate lyase isoform 2-T7 [Spinachia spinachia]
MSLSVAERKLLAGEWCQKAKGKINQVIVHVGCLSLTEAKELAAHAVEIGADAIAAMAPFFFKPKTADALRSFLQEVALAAPTLPFFYYHIPAVTGVDVPVRDLLKGIKGLIPSFGGVKFSATDLMDLGQCISSSPPHWSFLYGVDEQLLAGLVMGADGAVGSTYNYAGCHFNKLMSAFKDGHVDQARKIQFKIQQLLSYAMELGFDVGVNKQLMNELSGLSLGPPRLPVTPCSLSDAGLIAKKYRQLFNDC